MSAENETIISSLQSELLKLHAQIPPFKKTYLDILKVSGKEVPIANLLSYFFDPNESHEIGNLFIKALFDTNCHDLKTHGTIGKLSNNGYMVIENDIVANPDFVLNDITDAQVISEDPTEEHKRIDILIKTKQFVIAIEFKINHVLDNPLNLYQNHILKEHCVENNKPVFFVILSPVWKEHENQKIANNSFKQVIISSFVDKIKHYLTDDIRAAISANPYYPLLNDFIQTIENRKKHKELRQLLLKESTATAVDLYKKLRKNNLTPSFRARSGKQVKHVLSKLITIKEDITAKLNSVKKKFKETAKYKEIDCFEGFVEIEIPNSVYAIKCRLTLDGWRLEAWKHVPGKGFTARNNDILDISFEYETSSTTIAIRVNDIIAKFVSVEAVLIF